jgi:hypothetical protein
MYALGVLLGVDDGVWRAEDVAFLRGFAGGRAGEPI